MVLFGLAAALVDPVSPLYLSAGFGFLLLLVPSGVFAILSNELPSPHLRWPAVCCVVITGVTLVLIMATNANNNMLDLVSLFSSILPFYVTSKLMITWPNPGQES